MGQDIIFGRTSRVAVVVGNSQSRDAVAKALQGFRFEEIFREFGHLHSRSKK
jgi:hypothetical protein